MVYYLIVCRSLTYAQRTASALERAGITAHILRSPKMISGEGAATPSRFGTQSSPGAADFGPRRADAQAHLYHVQRRQL